MLFKNISIALLVSSASAYLGCPIAEIGNEEQMLQEANCLVHRSDINKDAKLSHPTTRNFVSNYLENQVLVDNIIDDIEYKYGQHLERPEFYEVYGYLKYH